MIFVTVGTQLPFDRLVQAVDQWALDRDRHDVFAQIGPTHWQPQRIEAVPFLDPPAFEKQFEAATAIVSHAGMGTIISALERGKPLVIMARRAELEEHRNDHQLATVKRFEQFQNIHIAHHESQLAACLDSLASLSPAEVAATRVSPRLLEVIRTFVGQPTVPVQTLLADATKATAQTQR